MLLLLDFLRNKVIDAKGDDVSDEFERTVAMVFLTGLLLRISVPNLERVIRVCDLKQIENS